uniref:Uncharacterized protein n=1 Tax=Parascaris univalens TaxID=6257 RepID=A0A915B9B4_PARUN
VREDSKMRQVVLWLLCTSSVLLFAQSIAKVVCKPSEVLLTLNIRETHDVPVCHPIALYPNGERKPLQSGPMKRNRFTCDALICKRCRCDVGGGYMLSDETDNAYCVRECPITKRVSTECANAKNSQIC